MFINQLIIKFIKIYFIIFINYKLKEKKYCEKIFLNIINLRYDEFDN